MAEFNPAEHNVEEVNAYLESADDNERSRVLELEEAGPNRKTVRRDWSESGSEPEAPADEADPEPEAPKDPEPKAKKSKKSKGSKPKGGFLDTGALVGIPPYTGPTRS